MEPIYVYVAKIPDNGNFLPVHPTERSEYIEAATSERVRRERYYVWRLFGYAVKDGLGLDADGLAFSRDGGRWSCDKCHFSLAHGDGAVAVAVSRCVVGIDIEEIKPPRAESFKERILTAEERELCGEADAVALWCKKEALFKMGGGASFIPREVNTAGAECELRKTCVGGKEYYLAVAGEEMAEIILHENIVLR